MLPEWLQHESQWDEALFHRVPTASERRVQCGKRPTQDGGALGGGGHIALDITAHIRARTLGRAGPYLFSLISKFQNFMKFIFDIIFERFKFQKMNISEFWDFFRIQKA